jgi:hypothetical protein
MLKGSLEQTSRIANPKGSVFLAFGLVSAGVPDKDRGIGPTRGRSAGPRVPRAWPPGILNIANPKEMNVL